jgi:hypothetical protein
MLYMFRIILTIVCGVMLAVAIYHWMNFHLLDASMLGRPLKPKEVVHHKDGNSLNNHPNNLIICDDNAEHRQFHRGEMWHRKKRIGNKIAETNC